MREVGKDEVEHQFEVLLAEVEETGRAIAIMRDGRRVARLEREPVTSESTSDRPKRPVEEVIREMLAWRDEMALKNPGLAEPYDLRADRDSIE